MKKENCKWKLEWDYNGYDKTKYLYVEQYDWNQTLVTKINQASANICRSTHNCATTLEVNTKTHKLLETLEYYDITHHTMGNRYTVIINDDIEDNVIILYHKTEFISKLSKEKNEDGWYELINIPKTECTIEEVKEYEYICSGYVEILNYNNEENKN